MPSNRFRDGFRPCAARRIPPFTRSSRHSNRRTGCPVLVITSFNVRGEPIVCTPEDAYRCFMRTHIDVLILETFILEKAEHAGLVEDGTWLDEFVLD
jgi:carbamoyltransferase